MAGGWSRDGAVQDQIDASVEDEVQRARSQLNQGESASPLWKNRKPNQAASIAVAAKIASCVSLKPVRRCFSTVPGCPYGAGIARSKSLL